MQIDLSKNVVHVGNVRLGILDIESETWTHAGMTSQLTSSRPYRGGGHGSDVTPADTWSLLYLL